MFDIEHAAEKPLYVIRAEDGRQLLRLLRKRQDLFLHSVPLERDTEEEAQRRNGGVDRT